MEEWRQINNYENYVISNFGKIMNSNGRLLKPSKTIKGYLRVFLTSNGKGKNFKVHRLVAQAFIPNVNNYPQVNHIDCDKANNHVSNLEWVTNQMNMKHAYENGKSHRYRVNGKYAKKPI